MPAKFLVVECDDNENAVKLVRLMLENGFSRMMLLDDLSKHPSLVLPRSCDTLEQTILNTNLNQIPSKSSSATLREEARTSNSRISSPTTSNCRSDSETNQRILDMIHSYNDDDLQFNMKSDLSLDDDNNGECLADSEEGPTNFFDFTEGLDLLAQAQQSLAGASDTSPNRKSKLSDIQDPDKYYHKCRLCGTKVKAPRGGRWNLQMHVMAMHSNKRSLQCPECDYTDYRKPGMRKHTILTHGADLQPLDIATDDKRKEWDQVMSKCFPEFAHRTGFLEKA